MRNEGTALFNLLRNVGSSIGISVVMFLLTQNIQRLHAALAEHITPYNLAGNPAAAPPMSTSSTPEGLLALNALITNQSAMIAYIDDFKLMMVLTLLTIPFLLLIRNAKPAAVRRRGAGMNRAWPVCCACCLACPPVRSGPISNPRRRPPSRLCRKRRRAAAGRPARGAGEKLEGDWWAQFHSPRSIS